MTWNSLSADALFDELPDAALVVDEHGVVVAVNAAARNLFELAPDKPGDGPLLVTELLTQRERARLDPLTWLRRWADSPDAPELRFVYLTSVTSTGLERQLGVRVARLPQTGGSTCYLALLRDISSWESRLRRERENSQIAQRVLATSLDAVLLVDQSQRVTWANRAAHELFGYEGDGLFGLPVVALLPERSRAVHPQLMRQFAAESAPTRLMSERDPVFGLTRDGTEFRVVASIARIVGAESTTFCVQLRSNSLAPKVANA